MFSRLNLKISSENTLAHAWKVAPACLLWCGYMTFVAYGDHDRSLAPTVSPAGTLRPAKLTYWYSICLQRQLYSGLASKRESEESVGQHHARIQDTHLLVPRVRAPENPLSQIKRLTLLKRNRAEVRRRILFQPHFLYHSEGYAAFEPAVTGETQGKFASSHNQEGLYGRDRNGLEELGDQLRVCLVLGVKQHGSEWELTAYLLPSSRVMR